MTSLVINVVGVPAPQGSKRAFVVNGRAVMTESSKKVKPWRQDVTHAIRDILDDPHVHTPDLPLTTPIDVTVTFYMPRPRHHYGTGRNAGVLKPTAPTYVDKKPDVDKLLRSTLDALTASGLIRDDAQVVHLTGVKRYADAATGARITITPMTAVAPAPEGEADNGATAPQAGVLF